MLGLANRTQTFGRGGYTLPMKKKVQPGVPSAEWQAVPSNRFSSASFGGRPYSDYALGLGVARVTIFVVVEELIPEGKQHSHMGTFIYGRLSL